MSRHDRTLRQPANEASGVRYVARNSTSLLTPSTSGPERRKRGLTAKGSSGKRGDCDIAKRDRGINVRYGHEDHEAISHGRLAVIGATSAASCIAT